MTYGAALAAPRGVPDSAFRFREGGVATAGEAAHVRDVKHFEHNWYRIVDWG